MKKGNISKHVSDNRLMGGIYKNFYNSIKNTAQLKMGKYLNRNLQKMMYKRTVIHGKAHSTSLGKCKLKLHS